MTALILYNFELNNLRVLLGCEETTRATPTYKLRTLSLQVYFKIDEINIYISTGMSTTTKSTIPLNFRIFIFLDI